MGLRRRAEIAPQKIIQVFKNKLVFFYFLCYIITVKFNYFNPPGLTAYTFRLFKGALIMSKKEVNTTETEEKVKPAFSNHLEELLKEQGLQKKELAKLIFTSPQTISKACQGIRLTRPMAESIVGIFPQYYIGWLLGYPGSPKYVSDLQVQVESEKERAKQRSSSLNEQFFEILAEMCTSYVPGINADYEDGLLTIKTVLFPESVADDSNSEVSSILKKEELQELKKDVIAFLEYRLSKEICKSNKTVTMKSNTVLSMKEA